MLFINILREIPLHAHKNNIRVTNTNMFFIAIHYNKCTKGLYRYFHKLLLHIPFPNLESSFATYFILLSIPNILLTANEVNNFMNTSKFSGSLNN